MLGLITLFLKYFVEGFAIAVAAYVIPKRRIDFNEILMISLVGASILSILDYFTPLVGHFSRQGSGFGIGRGLADIEGFTLNDGRAIDVIDLLKECDNVNSPAEDDTSENASEIVNEIIN